MVDLLSILTGSNSYRGVGMKVVNVFKWQKSMQRSVNGRSFRIQIINTVIEQGAPFISKTHPR